MMASASLAAPTRKSTHAARERTERHEREARADADEIAQSLSFNVGTAKSRMAKRPTNARAQHNLALMHLGRPADALPHLEAARRLAPDDAEIARALAQVNVTLRR